jgi:hypothetical protein
MIALPDRAFEFELAASARINDASEAFAAAPIAKPPIFRKPRRAIPSQYFEARPSIVSISKLRSVRWDHRTASQHPSRMHLGEGKHSNWVHLNALEMEIVIAGQGAAGNFNFLLEILTQLARPVQPLTHRIDCATQMFHSCKSPNRHLPSSSHPARLAHVTPVTKDRFSAACTDCHAAKRSHNGSPPTQQANTENGHFGITIRLECYKTNSMNCPYLQL